MPANPSVSLAGIDEYITLFPKKVQAMLKIIETLINKSTPQAQETIQVPIPTFTLNGNLVHFEVFTHHIGFYLYPSGIYSFKKELSGYQSAKGSVKFPLAEPIPYDVIYKIVPYAVRVHLDEAVSKKKEE